MPRKASAADGPRMCKILVKGPAPHGAVRGACNFREHAVRWRAPPGWISPESSPKRYRIIACSRSSICASS